jgi:uncharacterized protein (TIGR03382 family)
MRCTTILASLLVVVPSVAAAEGIELKDVRSPDLNYFEYVASPPTPSDITFARQLIPETTQPIAAVAQSRIIYLSKNGVTLTPGNNDARINRSTLVDSTRQIPAWNPSATVWSSTVTCLKDMFARWDVTVTDVDPGNVPHMEAIFTGSPSSIGMGSGVGGVSPFTQSCSVIENSIVFTFTNSFGSNAQVLCEVMAQEIAHSYGLDHQLTPEDPMTYLEYEDNRSFQDEMADCGEFESRECGIDGSVCRDRQNSVALLTNRLGRRGAEDDPPEPLTTTAEPEVGGCAASGSGGPLAGMAVIGMLLLRRRRRR